MTFSSLWFPVAFLFLGQPAAGSKPVTIAVVDVPHVSDRYLKRTEMEAQFDVKRQQFEKKRDSLRDRIQRTVQSLKEEFKPGTQEYRDRQKELVTGKAELQFFMESQEQQIGRELAGSLRTIFDDIHQVIGDIARERGIDLVLAADALPEGTPDNPTQVRQQIALQKVLYWGPRIDLTDEVVTRLNAQYKAQQSKSP